MVIYFALSASFNLLLCLLTVRQPHTHTNVIVTNVFLISKAKPSKASGRKMNLTKLDKYFVCGNRVKELQSQFHWYSTAIKQKFHSSIRNFLFHFKKVKPSFCTKRLGFFFCNFLFFSFLWKRIICNDANKCCREKEWVSKKQCGILWMSRNQ